MTTQLEQITERAVDLALVKLQLRVDHDDEDAFIEQLIAGATDKAGHITGRSIEKRIWLLRLDAFPTCSIRLSWPPVLAVDAIQYVDVNGITQTLPLERYIVDTHSEPARIVLPTGQVWPQTACVPNAVTVRYTAGYGANCPNAIQNWIYMQVGLLYRNRESVNVGNIVTEIPYVNGLLDRYRIWII